MSRGFSLLYFSFILCSTSFVRPGPSAPWYSRFGHSLTAFDSDGDGEEDVMVLLGGFAPDPRKDVWVTTNGFRWDYVGEAPWAARGWHSALPLDGSLFVVGGSPLTNDIWAMVSLNKTDAYNADSLSTFQRRWVMEWEEVVEASASLEARAPKRCS